MMGINGITNEWLHQKYVVEGRLAREVARLARRRTRCIRHRLRDLGILKSQSEAALLHYHPYGEKYTLFDSAGGLQKLYVDEKLSIREVGRLTGRSSGSVIDGLEKWGIPIRTRSSGNGRRGSGVARNQRASGFTKILRREVRDRDGNRCVICGTIRKDRSLDVHHRNFDRDDHCPGNLVTLCQSCHGWVHANHCVVTILEGAQICV